MDAFRMVNSVDTLQTVLMPFLDFVYREVKTNGRESMYHKEFYNCLFPFLRWRVQTEATLPYQFTKRSTMTLKCDMLLFLNDECYVLELKADKNMSPDDIEQLRQYIRLNGAAGGLLINFSKNNQGVRVKRFYPGEPDAGVVLEIQTKEVRPKISPKLSSIEKLRPFSLAVVKHYCFIGDYTKDHFMRKTAGLVDFLRPLIHHEGAYSYVQTDRSKRCFWRLDDDMEWVKDPKGEYLESVISFIGSALEKRFTITDGKHYDWIDKVKGASADIMKDVRKRLSNVWTLPKRD